MDPTVKVALVKSDRRRGAVAEAIALLGPELRGIVRGPVLIKPNLVSHQAKLPSTHVDTFSAVLDSVLALGASEITVAEGASDASAGFDRFGFRREAWGRPVRFLDINRDETAWEPLELRSVKNAVTTARVSRTMVHAPCRVSLAVAKTHVTAMLTLSIKNMLSSIHPDDRVLMHGQTPGHGYTGWRRVLINTLKQDHAAVGALTRILGHVRRLKAIVEGKAGARGWERLSDADRRFLETVVAMNWNLQALFERVRPHLSVVDGFIAMHGEGPRHGSPIRLGTIIAGTDPVAVDAVAAAVMGFDPLAIGYLRSLHESGLGVADLERITIVGDPLSAVRRRCVPHSNHYVQRHWPRLAARSTLSGPHQPVVSTLQEVGTP